jgi:hypothetical protein
MPNLYKHILEERDDNKLGYRKMIRILAEFIEQTGREDECLGYISLACEEARGDI